MSTFHTFDDHNREHDHHPDVELGGLDDEIRRHRQIAADMNRSPHDREVAAVKAATIKRCVYLLRGKSLVGVGAATLYLLHRFHRAVVVSTAGAAITGATIVAAAAPLAPANPPRIAAAPPAVTRPQPHPPLRHHKAAGPAAGTQDAADTQGLMLAGGPSANDAAPPTVAGTPPTAATQDRARSATPPPTVAPTTQARATAPTRKIPDPQPTTTPTSRPTQPTTEPTSPSPTSTPIGHDPILKVTLPLPLPTIRVGPILGVN